MKNHSIFSSTPLFIGLLSLSVTFTGFVPANAEAKEVCATLCGVTSENAKNMISDKNCKNSTSCVNCVVKNLNQSQSGAYCTSYNKQTKGQKIETFTATLNTGAALSCAASCVLGTVAGPVLDRVCGGLGIAIMVTEVTQTIAGLTKQDGNLMGLATQVISAEKTFKLLKKGTQSAGLNLKNPACVNAVMFGITAAAKIKGMKKMKSGADASCQTVEQLAGTVAGPVQACLNTNAPSTGAGTTLAGLFTATGSSYSVPTPADVDTYASTASGTDPFLREMKADLQSASDAGKIDMATISKKIESGSSPSSILAEAGLPSELVEVLKENENRIEAGESSKVLASIVGGGYSGESAGRAVASTGDTGFSEMGFGTDATPGEGHELLEIQRLPAERKPSLLGSDDIFHSSFPGTIFEIITDRIKEQKDQYVQAEPEGRMNRIFNGYSDPKNRAPAATASPKTKLKHKSK